MSQIIFIPSNNIKDVLKKINTTHMISHNKNMTKICFAITLINAMTSHRRMPAVEQFLLN